MAAITTADDGNGGRSGRGAAAARLYDEACEHFVRRGSFFRPNGRDPASEYPTDQGFALAPGLRKAVFGAGCFWGTEKSFWRLPGVVATAGGYMNGQVAHPTYRHVCSGKTGHAEATLVIWNPAEIGLADLLRHFLACHDPTQGHRQGQDRGSQYRSTINVATPAERAVCVAALQAFDSALLEHGYGRTTTELYPLDAAHPFWYAEPYHQQYLAKPGNRQYCSAEPTGVPLPPYSAWAPEASGAGEADAYAACAARLPREFWDGFDGSVGAPNAPATWSGGPDAEAEARAAARAAAAQWAEEIAAAERASGVVIRFCGGCGFKRRATELAEYLLAATGVRPALLQDAGTTGNFDVSVRRRGVSAAGGAAAKLSGEAEEDVAAAAADGTATAAGESKVGGGSAPPDAAAAAAAAAAVAPSLNSAAAGLSSDFELVHSKKVPLRGLVQDGFVDTPAKIERILRAMAASGVATAENVERALAGSTALPKSVVSPLGRGDHQKSAATFLDFWTDKRAPLVMVAKSWCKHCKRALAALEDKSVHPFVLQIDKRADESEIPALLGQRTGNTTVPSVWRRGKYLGGADETVSDIQAGGVDGGDDFDGWARDVGVDAAWDWVDEMGSLEKDLLDGAEFYKFMAPNHIGEKVLRPPRRNNINKSRRPAL